MMDLLPIMKTGQFALALQSLLRPFSFFPPSSSSTPYFSASRHRFFCVPPVLLHAIVVHRLYIHEVREVWQTPLSNGMRNVSVCSPSLSKSCFFSTASSGPAVNGPNEDYVVFKGQGVTRHDNQIGGDQLCGKLCFGTGSCRECAQQTMCFLKMSIQLEGQQTATFKKQKSAALDKYVRLILLMSRIIKSLGFCVQDFIFHQVQELSYARPNRKAHQRVSHLCPRLIICLAAISKLKVYDLNRISQGLKKLVHLTQTQGWRYVSQLTGWFLGLFVCHSCVTKWIFHVFYSFAAPRLPVPAED